MHDKLIDLSDEPTTQPNNLPKVLVVDDRPENLHATEKILRNLDVELVKASSGNEALSSILHHTFAVVLLDVQMPEMDGFETASLMQEYEGFKDTPIIFVTAISKEDRYASQAAEIGAVDYIFKPINPDILKSKVTVYVELFRNRESILRLNKELQQNYQELERFSYVCSHDLQEPARIMGNYAALLESKYKENLDERGQKFLNFIKESSTHMQKMIVDILTFSKIGKEELHIEMVDCNSVLQDILENLSEVITEKRAEIKADPLPTLPMCQTLIRILLHNLINNAIKFHAPANNPIVTITVKEQTKDWLFQITDNGIGIDEGCEEKVFTIFQRIHRKEDYSGTGIGLSTCKKFLEQYDGKIWYDSVIGEGATFNFTIPKNIPVDTEGA